MTHFPWPKQAQRPQKILKFRDLKQYLKNPMNFAIRSCLRLKKFLCIEMGEESIRVHNVTRGYCYLMLDGSKFDILSSRVLAGGQGGNYPPPLRVKYEGRQNGNLKHMGGAEGALVEMLAK